MKVKRFTRKNMSRLWLYFGDRSIIRKNEEMQMNILVIGWTIYIGTNIVNKLFKQECEVTIETRDKTPDLYGDKVERITIQRTNEESMEGFIIWKASRLKIGNNARVKRRLAITKIQFCWCYCLL